MSVCNLGINTYTYRRIFLAFFLSVCPKWIVMNLSKEVFAFHQASYKVIECYFVKRDSKRIIKRCLLALPKLPLKGKVKRSTQFLNYIIIKIVAQIAWENLVLQLSMNTHQNK